MLYNRMQKCVWLCSRCKLNKKEKYPKCCLNGTIHRLDIPRSYKAVNVLIQYFPVTPCFPAFSASLLSGEKRIMTFLLTCISSYRIEGLYLLFSQAILNCVKIKDSGRNQYAHPLNLTDFLHNFLSSKIPQSWTITMYLRQNTQTISISNNFLCL